MSVTVELWAVVKEVSILTRCLKCLVLFLSILPISCFVNIVAIICLYCVESLNLLLVVHGSGPVDYPVGVLLATAVVVGLGVPSQVRIWAYSVSAGVVHAF